MVLAYKFGLAFGCGGGLIVERVWRGGLVVLFCGFWFAGCGCFLCGRILLRSAVLVCVVGCGVLVWIWVISGLLVLSLAL